MLSLCLHLSSLKLCHLISAMVVILFGLDYVISSVLAYLHFIWFRLCYQFCFSLFTFFARRLFVDKLELIICNLGV